MTIDTESLFSQPRFQPPQNWDWSFRELSGIKIRYGLARIRKNYDAVALIIGGLGDFGEQYFEFCHDLEARNIKPIIIDLPGQGGSGRYLDNPHKRHSAGFDELLKDLHILIDEIVLSAAIDNEDNHKRLPIILFAHSMGGHLALRYLSEYNRSSRGATIFSAAAITAPMVKIRVLESLPTIIANPLVRILALRSTSYIPGGSDWFPEYREQKRITNAFSRDPDRGSLQLAFFSHPDYQHLAVGSPTTKWLADAIKSRHVLHGKNYLERIETPILISLAGQDHLVSNDAAREAAKRIKNSELQEIEGSSHEILMESDEYRSAFLDRFFTFIENNVFNREDRGKTFIQ